MIPRGVKSNDSSTIFVSFSGETLPVPNVSTNTERGLATPMAYESWISQRSASPAATTFFAACRAA